ISASAAARKAVSTARSTGRVLPLTRVYDRAANASTARASTAASHATRGAASTTSPRSNSSGRYLNRNSKSDSPIGSRQWLMAHTVDDHVHADLVRVRRVADRVERVVRPLPRIPQVRVEVDQHHQPAVVIQNAA